MEGGAWPQCVGAVTSTYKIEWLPTPVSSSLADSVGSDNSICKKAGGSTGCEGLLTGLAPFTVSSEGAGGLLCGGLACLCGGC